jgi:hypothetical protein
MRRWPVLKITRGRDRRGRKRSLKQKWNNTEAGTVPAVYSHAAPTTWCCHYHLIKTARFNVLPVMAYLLLLRLYGSELGADQSASLFALNQLFIAELLILGTKSRCFDIAK